MSDEKFKRSEIGHNANDLHKHGGLDGAHEEKTERESLEEAIEELNDSEETENLEKIEKDMDGEIGTEDIEEINDKESEPVAGTPIQQMSDEEIDEKVAEVLKEHAAEPENGWKTKAENQAYMTIDTVEEPKTKKKCGAGWKFATIFFLLLAVAGCGATAYLFFNNGKTELMGRTIESYDTGKKEESSTAKTAPVVENTEKFDPAKYIIDVATLNKVTNDPYLKVKKLEFSEDGKYLIALMTDSNAAGVWYKSLDGGTWTLLEGGQTFSLCSEYTDEQKKLMESFKTFDDDLGSKYIGCFLDTSATTTYPE